MTPPTDPARPQGASPRRRQILEALALELEEKPGDRITTARLAAVVGVSEAALYRHFPSKARMFESLIEFAEESVFGVVTRILREHDRPEMRCAQILRVVLTFADRNPGITRVLVGEALVGESETLRTRAHQYFERLETQLRQVLREGGSATEPAMVSVAAGLMMAALEGRLRQFLRSRFERRPLEGWDGQWTLLHRAIFPPG